MNDLNLIKGCVLVAIALAFGLQSLHYPLGTFSRMGPGMFPLLVSGLLLLLGVAILVRSRLVKRVPIVFNGRNIVLILASLCGFALISEHLNMIAGIVFMVFCASLAGTSYSVARNLKIAAGLIAVAFAFQKLLGLQLPLY
jgi:Tripartite tricarboxylate transporter TctB family